MNGRTVVQARLFADAPTVRTIDTGGAPRAVIETEVDRTWKKGDGPANEREVGLKLSWRFAPP